MKKKSVIILNLILLLVCMGMFCTGCWKKKNEIKLVNDTDLESEDDLSELIVVGFSQLGAESDWRSANSKSMKEIFTKENGYKLIFDDGQQKQSNQITAIRKFIQQEVDYIVLAPVTEEGWDTVLQEAKEAGIPVIIVDRMVKVSDDSLFTCWVGSDFELEGKKAVEWLHHFAMAKNIAPQDFHIVNIQGNIGASAQIGRTNSLVNAARLYGWDLKDMQPGDFTQVKGKEVMTNFLKQYDDINVVYCENDNEALGAIEAIENAGKKVGSNIAEGEIMIISFDGVNAEAMEYVANGKITCIAECNPHHGPRVQTIIETLEKNEKPKRFEFVDEEIYTAIDTVKQVGVEGRNYDVTILSK